VNDRVQQRLTDIDEAITAIGSHLARGDLSDGLIFDARTVAASNPWSVWSRECPTARTSSSREFRHPVYRRRFRPDERVAGRLGQLTASAGSGGSPATVRSREGQPLTGWSGTTCRSMTVGRMGGVLSYLYLPALKNSGQDHSRAGGSAYVDHHPTWR
jgi:hypothetical protein